MVHGDSEVTDLFAKDLNARNIPAHAPLYEEVYDLSANAMLAKSVAPNLPEELKESKAGSVIAKVVTGANALLQGTAMLTLADETREMEGGLILRDGNVEVNCAFETQLRVLRETMAADIAAILFA